MLARQKRRRSKTAAPLQRGRRQTQGLKQDLREPPEPAAPTHAAKEAPEPAKDFEATGAAKAPVPSTEVGQAREAAKATMAGSPDKAAPEKPDQRLKQLPIHR